ncbi:hypothetical protein EYZ11_010655 [Aspergillus tanneri]|uniref:BZIP domain-containing protein n=1 Tax=Aspergillus tanneri TaxID=1220188 RepID=A0A4S3J4S4_9EURO|nr:hypothetical protein EYZ11_010655 [Aspergillus tanneri]
MDHSSAPPAMDPVSALALMAHCKSPNPNTVDDLENNHGYDVNNFYPTYTIDEYQAQFKPQSQAVVVQPASFQDTYPQTVSLQAVCPQRVRVHPASFLDTSLQNVSPQAVCPQGTPSSRATKDRGAYSTPSKNKVMKKQPATYARSQALRERNRIAASRCRERKKAQEADLIQRSQELVNRREGFQDKLNGMKDELIKQKNMVFAHINCGESGVQSYVNTMASMLDIGAILSST